MQDQQRKCRRCDKPAEKGPYCRVCADKLMAAALTAPVAPPQRGQPFYRQQGQSRPNPAQPKLFG